MKVDDENYNGPRRMDSASSDQVPTGDRPNQLAFSSMDDDESRTDDNGLSSMGVVSCPAASVDEKDSCVVCGEGFETFWKDEMDEWHLKDAVRVNDKTYHTVCFEDAAKTTVGSTPSSPTFTPRQSVSDIAILPAPERQSEEKQQVNNGSPSEGILDENNGGVKQEPTSVVKMETATAGE